MLDFEQMTKDWFESNERVKKNFEEEVDAIITRKYSGPGGENNHVVNFT